MPTLYLKEQNQGSVRVGDVVRTGASDRYELVHDAPNELRLKPHAFDPASGLRSRECERAPRASVRL
jgi:hypothetical protein